VLPETAPLGRDVDFNVATDEAAGGISSAGTTTITSSQVDRNVAATAGGGIFNDDGAVLSLSDSEVDHNAAPSQGVEGACKGVAASSTTGLR
jgi:hypothetical protein